MKQYKNWAPTGWDTAGLNCPDRQAWYVVPLAHNRESDILDLSNWAEGLERLEAADAEGDTYDVLQFGHWAVGWIEVLVVKRYLNEEDELEDKETPAFEAAVKIELDMEEYPILNSEDYGEREYQQGCDDLDGYLTHDLPRLLSNTQSLDLVDEYKAYEGLEVMAYDMAFENESEFRWSSIDLDKIGEFLCENFKSYTTPDGTAVYPEEKV